MTSTAKMTTGRSLDYCASSPEMFESDLENEISRNESFSKKKKKRKPADELPEATLEKTNPEVKLTQAELVAQSDKYLLARINKFLTGVPPPPKHTICQNDCSEFLLRIYENQRFFWSETATNVEASQIKRREEEEDEGEDEEEETKSECKENQFARAVTYQRTRSTSRNLSHAFDACEKDSAENWLKGDNIRTHAQVNAASQVNALSDSSEAPLEQKVLYCTINETKASLLGWSEAYRHKFHGIHYNRNRSVEEFENLTQRLCERYIGAETQSTCNVWFSKQAPGSARKRSSMLAKRDNGQSPGKRLSHLTRRRRTFSSANLQGLGIGDKKQLVVNVKKSQNRKGKSPRGKSPRGKSPRSSTKKKVARRLTLDGHTSPAKTALETSTKRALFQSPTSSDHCHVPHYHRAGPSKLFVGGSTPQNIKRALFSVREDESAGSMPTVVESESRKRKNEEELEPPRIKWAKSLSFDCTGELHSSHSLSGSWDVDRHASTAILERSKFQGKQELSDTHRKKLLWAVAEALRSKGIGMSHPQFKQYASTLARTVKKFMPDLENRSIPRKPGSTSDRMLKLAKHHVLFIIDGRPTN